MDTKQGGFMMEWYQVGTIVAANLGLFLWTVRQSRADYLHCQKSIDSFKDVMTKESKDFHGRLERMDCEFKMRIFSLEERSKK